MERFRRARLGQAVGANVSVRKELHTGLVRFATAASKRYLTISQKKTF
jgi:hypothetical protein